MSNDFNAELHARPSIYFAAPAYVEHIALMPSSFKGIDREAVSSREWPKRDDEVRTQVEYHTEFVTVTRVTHLSASASKWPETQMTEQDIVDLIGDAPMSIICRTGILVCGPAPEELGPSISAFEFRDSVASSIGGGSAVVCSDFRVRPEGASRIVLFNKDLNSYRLGRMVRRIYEIETYRSMALLGLPSARRLAPLLDKFDSRLVELTARNLNSPDGDHKELLFAISELSAQVISAAAETRNRFGASLAYSKIVEERISELREAHVPGFQRFGVFVARRFKPAIRTCEATSLRLEQLSQATMHLLDLLQTRIQSEIEFQNAVQIKAMADRAATQIKIQHAVEGFSVIAISYYLLGILKTGVSALEHFEVHVPPAVTVVAVPLVIIGVLLLILRVKRNLQSDH
jgi:uncharacterized membrane-anchored protein